MDANSKFAKGSSSGTAETDNRPWKVKGMTARLTGAIKKGNELFDYGQTFILKAPPGWDAILKEQAQYKGFTASAFTMGTSVVTALFAAAAFALY